jgi:phosphoglycolate phosphatase
MSRIRGILFDKDGTLIDFNATWAAVARKMAMQAASGDAVKADRLLDISGLDLATGGFRPDSIFAAGTNADLVALWHPHLEREELTETVAMYDALTAREGAASAVVLSGIRDAIARLHAAGYRLGMATNDSTLGAEQTLVALGFAHMFAAAYGYDAVARPKPAPDVVIAFADMAGMKTSEIAMVGDNRHDLETGRAAGAGLIVGVLSGTGTRATLAPLADVILDSVADLPGYLEGAFPPP